MTAADRVIAAAVAGLILAAGSAAAQTTGLDPLAAIAGPESTNCANQQNATSSASGCFQQLTASWDQYAPQVGIDINQYPTAASAPYADQFAAAAAQYNAVGFSAWAPYDPSLAATIAANGGDGAYIAPGNLSTDPASYASLNDPAALAAYFNGASTGDTVTFSNGTNLTTGGNGTIASGAAANGVTGSAASGSSFNPFTYLWMQYSLALAQPLAAELASVQTMIQSPLLSLLSLSVMLMSLVAYTGRMVMTDFFNRIIRIAAVVAFTGVGSTLYNEYVVQFFGGLPTWFSNNILGGASANPAAGFDVVFHTFTGQVANVWWNLPWGVSTTFVDGPIIAICCLIVFLAIALMFTVWLIAQALLQLLIVLGPLMILGILFDHTKGWFDRWVSACMLMIFVTLAADIISSLVLKEIIGAMNSLPNIGGATETTQSVFNIVGVTLVVFVLGAAVAILPRLLQHIAAASGAPVMDHAQRLLGGATSAVTRGAGRVAGAGARAAVRS